MIALARHDDAGFRAGVAQLRKLKPDAPVARILARIAAADRSAGWMPALIAAWGEERKPELRNDPFLLPSFEPQSTLHPGRAGAQGGWLPWGRRRASRPRSPIGTTAGRALPRPRRCSRRRGATPRGRTRACGSSRCRSSVEPFLSPDSASVASGRRRRRSGAMAKAHPDDPFFQLIAMAGPDAETAPVGAQALEKLESLVRGGALRLPGTLLRETLTRHLGPDDFRDFGLSTAVEVVLDIDLERYLERFLSQAGESDRRMAVVPDARGGAGPERVAGPAVHRSADPVRRRRADRDRAGQVARRRRRSPAVSGCGAGGRCSRALAGGRRPRFRTSSGRGVEDEVGVLERYATLGAE